MRWGTAILPCALLAMIVGCAPAKPRTAAEYFTDANTRFRQGALTMAIDEFHELLDQHPFSEHNEEAELKIAHAQYLSGNYAEAVVALSDFQRRHPTSPHLPFVGYYLGMCYVKQMGSIDTDQTAAQNAHTYFITVTRQYPDSPYALLANQQLAHCRETLAEHELYVADFYTRHGNNKAAEIRMLNLASRYGETDAAADALLKLASLYRDTNQAPYAVLAYRTLIEDNPKSPQAEEARQALAKLSGEEVGSGDPLDQLLAANGRQRSTATFDTVKLPDPTAVHTARRAPPPAPAGFGPASSPFGGGRPY
jgi:outer membrane protein assembly factor BamD